MNKSKQNLLFLTVTFILCGLIADAGAALHDRGRGLIYDDVLDIIWTQNANLIATYTYPDSPFISGYAGFNDWRNPTVNVDNIGIPMDCATSTEQECRDNELGYMFYYNVGGTWRQDLTGNQGLIMNIQDVYYSSDPWPGDPTYRRWVFCFSNKYSSPWDGVCGAGEIGFFDIVGGDHFPRWAVRDGDVPAVVPEPISTALFLTDGAYFAVRKMFRKKLG